MAGADGNGRVLPDAEAIQSPEADDEGELPESLEEALLDAASDRKSTRLNSSHMSESRMPSSA